MSRLPNLRRDELSPANQQVWDRVMSGRTGSGGPYGVLIMPQRSRRGYRLLKTISVMTRCSPPRIRNS
jgi:hypothetical protein